MTNLSKLDETVDQLEKQAEMLKQNNRVLAKVSELSSVIEKGVNELAEGNKNFEGTKKDIQGSIKSLNENIEVLITSNKKFLREFEDAVSSKLERFSSDIQVTIRQERSQLQESLLSGITTQFSNLESKQKALFENQAKQLSLLKYLSIIAILCSLGIGIYLFVK